jgi:broad specificity phosphatase PhoE
MVIRHGEKPDDSNPGVDAQGNEDDSSLTQIGWNRAHRLVDLFDPAQGPPRPGLARPKAIYAAGANDNGEGARTRETVKPLADQLGVPVNASFGKGDEEALVEHVISQPGPTLISWQHGRDPRHRRGLPSVTPTPRRSGRRTGST